jgi:hypothetical protein
VTDPVDDVPVSEEAVRAKTGRGWDAWFSLLDDADAATLPHREIVALAAEHGAPPWWAQMVTVAYERARGLRQRHERPDGYAVSVSRTFAAPIERVFDAWDDSAQRPQWLADPGLKVRRTTPPKSLRLTWPDGSAVDLYLTARSAEKTQLALNHRKLTAQEDVAAMRAFWRAQLDALGRHLG